MGTGLKLWQLNEADLWLAPTIGSAIDAAMLETGLPFDELLTDIHSVREVDEEEMLRLKFDDSEGHKSTCAEEYRRQLGFDCVTPRLFASKEW